jgi:spartin
MAGASNLYIANSTPSTTTPNRTAAASPRPITPNSGSGSSSSASKSRSQANSPPPPPAHPSRTLLLLQSPTTRKNLTQIHAVSGSAAKLSSKAAATVDSLIQRAIGDGNSSSSSGSNPNPSFSSSADKGKGRSPTPQPQQQQGPTAAAAAAPLRKRTSVALSAALILASIEASAIRLVDAGSAAVTAAVTHKYGSTAGENAALAGRTARNIVLVYVDVRGLGRRVIVKRMTKSWVKGRIASAKQEAAAHKR